jgi:hypothetical protein
VNIVLWLCAAVLDAVKSIFEIRSICATQPEKYNTVPQHDLLGVQFEDGRSACLGFLSLQPESCLVRVLPSKC